MNPIIRVFPTKTKATPDDQYVRFGEPGFFDYMEQKEIHVSVTFSWDIERAKFLADQWSLVGNVKIGGVAMGDRGGQFNPGMYLKKGLVYLPDARKTGSCWIRLLEVVQLWWYPEN